MKRFTLGGTIVMSLLLSACGVESAPQAEESQPGTVEEALIPACNANSSFSLYWYSDSAKTKEVGRDDCDCGVATPHGTHGPYYKAVFFNAYCPTVAR